MEYPYTYKVMYETNGELINYYESLDKEKAIEELWKLRKDGAKKTHIQIALAKGGILAKGGHVAKKKFKVRFHLGKGKNFGKWKIENTKDNTDQFHDPEEVQLSMTNCKLTNQPTTANKIHAGAMNKAPIAYVQCDNVEIIDKDNFISYNPRKKPFWIDKSGTNIDDSKHEKIVSDKRQLFVKASDGYYAVGGLIENNKNIELGKKINLKLPNGETRNSHFAIMEIDDVLPSHNENSFESNGPAGYPEDENGENINDRNYTDDKNAQAKVIEFAQNLEPERLITTSRTPSGTPIVNDKGIVVSGNNRTMSLKRAIASHPEKYKEYTEFLKEEIEAFGITGENISQFKKPILVRIDYDIPALNTLELSKYNKDTKKSERPIDKAIKLGKLLDSNERCKTRIGEIVGQYETFSEFYKNFAEQKILLESLMSCDILTSQEKPSYFYERGFTDQGKELIENLMAGMVLSKNALVIANDKARRFRAIIITSLPVLTANELFGAESLIPELNEAIEIQGKIKSSDLDFNLWVNQKNLFDKPPSEDALYLNRLLATGRNNFKRSIEKYNDSVKANQGASLFGDPPTKKEIFQAHIIENVPEIYRKIITDYLEKSHSDEEPGAKPEVKKLKKKEMANPFVNNNYFKSNPDHVLAKEEKAVSRWKKPITIYKGSLDDLDRIEVKENFIEALKSTNPVDTIIDLPVEKLTDKNTEVVDNLEKAITQSPKDTLAKDLRKEKKKKVTTLGCDPTSDTYCLAEVYDMCNPEIDKIDLQVYLWYQATIDRPITNPEWYAIAEIPQDIIESVKTEQITSWVEQGKLFYFEGKLIPEYLYLSGNIYDKHQALVESELSENVGADAKMIIETYGQKAYEAQLKKLSNVYQTKYDNRLLIQSEGSESGLKLLPTSKFARKFMIASLIDETPFSWRKITAANNKKFGRPDILTDNTYGGTKKEFPLLSLTEAFCIWIRTDDTIQFKQGVTWREIIEYYINHKSKPRTEAVKGWDDTYDDAAKKIIAQETAAYERLKSRTKKEGDRLFNTFLDKFLKLNDKVKIETTWNITYNNNVPTNYNKIPVAFRMNRYIGGGNLDVRPEKREAVAFTLVNGSGLLAYDVGVGKTPAAIFTICQYIDMGYCKRPIVVVPNQTYKQWIAEFKKFAAHLEINEMYNLSNTIIADWQDVHSQTELVNEGSVTIMTFQGLKKLGFTEETEKSMSLDLSSILMQSTEGLSDKKAEREMLKINSKVEEILGMALARTEVNFEDFGFDYMCLDEAHAAKKVFTSVQGEAEENLGASTKPGRSVQQYKLQSGSPSSMAIKSFVVCQYIQKKYKGNTQLLTATPFTNSPLEVYSMLAMIAYPTLKAMNLNNLTTFFDTFVEISYEMVINAKMQPERKQIVLGFSNLLVLQQLVRQFINHKTGESVGVKRPNKVVLPLKTKVVDNVTMTLNEDEIVDCVLPLTPLQAELMDNIKLYAAGEIDETALCKGASIDDEQDEDTATAEGVPVDEGSMDAEEKVGVRLLKAMNHGRNLALSPFMFDCNTLGEPTAKQYIETSNKLKYVMDCIRSIKSHHQKDKSPMGGVVIYMDRGVKYFSLIREYLISEVGFEKHEVGIISAKEKKPTPAKMVDQDKKDYVKNLFLGKKFNESTLELEYIPDDERLKVLIGSSTIREGINLQEYSSTLFNCFLPWNPTDIQQLQGRIYRQGNAFKNVRIVNPLMIDSIDIFMFQKLEEKTSRINSVWETDGKTNVLKTEEFNPKELKYSLIKDPRILAKMEVLESIETLDENVADIKNQIKRNKKIKEYDNTISSNEPDLRKWLKEYRPKQVEKPLETLLKQAQIVLKTQKDKDGLPMAYNWAKQQSANKDIEYSTLTPASKPYWFDSLNIASRNLKRLEKEYLNPRGLGKSDVENYNIKLEEEIEEKEKEKKEYTSEESIARLTKRIIEKREELKIVDKSVDQVVNEFSSLNYLLDDVKKRTFKPAKIACPIVDAKGNPKTDSESLAQLDECLAHEPDTKLLHSVKSINEAGDEVLSYTPERKKLHDKIIKDLTKNTICLDQKQPIAIIMGGSPGSGKSTFLKKNAKYMLSDKIWKVDADEVRAELPEYKGWNSSATHQETRDIVSRLLGSYDKPCKHDLLYDGTMSNPKKYKPIIAKLKKQGYKIYIAYMDIPKKIAIERAMNRYKENYGHEAEYGRYVPISVINDFFTGGDKGYQDLKDSADGYIRVDSLSNKIVDKGGEDIPKDRDYSSIFSKSDEPAQEKEESQELSKFDHETALKGAASVVKYLTGEDKKEMQIYIKGLKSLIKYL